jgi:hypothetical protein
MNPLRIAGAILGSLSLAALTAHANPVTVQEEVGEYPGKTVSVTSSTLGTVTFGADIDVIKVNGNLTDAFCIDPWHFAHGGVTETYNEESLSLAPNAPGGPMGAIAATKIEQLWAEFFATALTDSKNSSDETLAAALQVAIWEVVASGDGTGTFTFNGPASVGTAAAADLAWLAANPGAPHADLVAIVPVGRGQAYVIPSIPDGGMTVLLLGIGLLSLVAVRRRRAVS